MNKQKKVKNAPSRVKKKTSTRKIVKKKEVAKKKPVIKRKVIKKKVVKKKPVVKKKVVKKKPVVKRKKLTIKQRNELILKNEIINEKLATILNDNGFILLKLLMEKRKTSEFKLSDIMGIKVNKIRSILYKLQTKKIVVFSKRRDKRKGWYIYTWEIKPKNIVESIIKDLESDINILEKKYHIRQEGKEFFSCNECAIQMKMLKAMETNYLCPYCESPMKVVDVESIKKDIMFEIDKIKKKIESLEYLR